MGHSARHSGTNSGAILKAALSMGPGVGIIAYGNARRRSDLLCLGSRDASTRRWSSAPHCPPPTPMSEGDSYCWSYRGVICPHRNLIVIQVRKDTKKIITFI